MVSFIAGFGTVFRGIGLLLREPKLRRLAIAPTVVSIVLLVLLVGGAGLFSNDLLNLIWRPDSGGWIGGLLRAGHVLASLLVFLLLLLVTGALFFFGATLAAEPFIDPLSEGVERALGAEPAKGPGGVGQTVRNTVWIFRDVGLDISLFVLAQILVWLLAFVPGVGPVLHLGVGWLVNAWFAGLEMTTGAAIRRGYRGRARWRALRRDTPRILGVGTAAVLLLLVPIVQLLTLPIAIVAGTIAVVDLQRQGKLPDLHAAPAAP